MPRIYNSPTLARQRSLAACGNPVFRSGSAGAIQPSNWKILLIGAALMLSGCTSGLPNYAAPKISVLSDEDMDMSDVITYRKLSRADFRGTQPPTNFDERMAAVTCVYTQPIVDKQAIDIQPATTAGGHQAYDVTFKNLKYRALMNRNCSWWNPNNVSSVEDYVLEHEQIHFALFEIAAREWSELPPLRIRVKADNSDAMKREMQAQFEDLLQQRLEVLLEQNRKFDEETSLGNNPAKQREWLESVRSRLPPGGESGAALPRAFCALSDAASASIARARAALSDSQQRAEMIHLIEEVETAVGAPECDSVRARILADKACQLVVEPAGNRQASCSWRSVCSV